MLKTFSIGGIHPRENKLSIHQPIVQAGIPSVAVIMLGQHIGAPAKPIVNKGDKVKVGTKIAEPCGFVSAAVHSSVSGRVSEIGMAIDTSGYPKPAVFIEVEGDEWEESIDRSDTVIKECVLSPENILKRIADAGIVGLGGACFPTHVKLAPSPSYKIECLIVNAVECEPYLTADHQLMLEHAEEIMVGVTLLMKAIKVDKAFIGIDYEDAFTGSGKHITDGESITFGNHELTVMLTPGHSPGSVFFYCEEEGMAFSGDTLFQMSVGRTDLELGDYDALIGSLRLIAGKLPGDTVILPGHGGRTTMKDELAYNPYLK